MKRERGALSRASRALRLSPFVYLLLIQPATCSWRMREPMKWRFPSLTTPSPGRRPSTSPWMCPFQGRRY
uniref:Hepatocyte cell adhesion molecule n=1 Tax=Mus musculus TaxID=10090 RepID=A0A1L1SUR4_MOUSE